MLLDSNCKKAVELLKWKLIYCDVLNFFVIQKKIFYVSLYSFVDEVNLKPFKSFPGDANSVGKNFH